LKHGYRDNARIHTDMRAYTRLLSLCALSLSLSLSLLSTLRNPLCFARSHSHAHSHPHNLYTPSAYIGRRRRAPLAQGERERAPRARGIARTGVDGCSAHGESGVNTERGVTQGRQQNAGIGEAVTMTTVTGEVLVRIRDHAYVTTP